MIYELPHFCKGLFQCPHRKIAGFFILCLVLKKVDQNLKKMVNDNFKRKQRPPRSYSENFKRLVVSEYESGGLNKDQLQRK